MFARWLDNLLLWHKFMILGVLGLLLVGPPLYLYVHNTNVAIAASLLEQDGNVPGKTSLLLLQQMQMHRGLSGVFLGANLMAEKRQAKQAEVDATLALLEKQLLSAGQGVNQRLIQVQADWRAVSGGVSNRSLSVAQSFQQHTALCLSVLKLLEGVADSYGLSLDPDADTYYLMRTVYFDAPPITEALGQARGKGAGILATRQIDPDTRAMMHGLLANASSLNAQLSNTLGKAFAANTALKPELGALLAEADKSASAAIELANTKVASAADLDYPATDYIGSFTRTIDGEFSLVGTSLKQLDRLIQQRIADQRQTRNLLTGVVMLIAALASLMAWRIALSVLRPMTAALAAVETIAGGDLCKPIAVGGRSEAGKMLTALQAMQTQLRATIGSVLANADAVAVAARQMAGSSHEVSLASARQSESSASMAAAVEQLTVSISHVSNNAGEAEKSATDAEGQARDGAKVIQIAASNIRGVAAELRGTAEVITELGAQSQQISGIVEVIREVANQTNLLALNAAIEAARAGEAGRGFAVVADEVRKLSERTSGATKEIGDMISRIQSYTAESVSGMHGAVKLVDEGVKQVNQAAEAIDHISTNATEVESAVDVISCALKEQMSASNQIAVNIEQIAQMSEENNSSALQSDQAAQTLLALAAKMRETILVFRLQ
ncbi:methyl-accepting chemotaxis protein [Chitinimonas arctica]|uniref:Methyl-accepting chemotaxis protein n=1 Tax=Chitinimonas arctica TaxID=2594795 RepID=A0A516SBU1_9NEIS|nr:methyl-accepting chemotaxis protein [Chitinimonas arctica]QDQ25611.1 methyl-accepting chemotaxis protein [Chitinimonas arctica]